MSPIAAAIRLLPTRIARAVRAARVSDAPGRAAAPLPGWPRVPTAAGMACRPAVDAADGRGSA